MFDPTDTSILCPLARTFASSPAVATCRGPDCALWRWEAITTKHPLWLPAVRARAAETGEKSPYGDAASWVAKNLADLGMAPKVGFCGAGGKP